MHTHVVGYIGQYDGGCRPKPQASIQRQRTEERAVAGEMDHPQDCVHEPIKTLQRILRDGRKTVAGAPPGYRAHMLHPRAYYVAGCSELEAPCDEGAA